MDIFNFAGSLELFDEQFAIVGYETSNIFMNSADIIVSSILALVFYWIFKMIYKMMGPKNRAKKYLAMLLKLVVYGLIIRFMLETFLSVTLSVWLNISFFSFEGWSEQISIAVTLILFISYFGLFVFSIIYLNI
jgi:hypothetical protein